METVASLSFPYFESQSTNISLNKLFLTDETDTTRYSIRLSENSQNHKKTCSSITKLDTATQKIIPELISYISNPSFDVNRQVTRNDGMSTTNTSTPLLVRIPPTYYKIKLNISILPNQISSASDKIEKYLIILKTTGDDDNLDTLKDSLINNNYDDKTTEISKLNYSLLPIDSKKNEIQRIIINDSFHRDVFQNNKLNISIWEFDNENSQNKFSFIFSFQLWVNEATVEKNYQDTVELNEDIISPNVQPLSPTPLPQNASSSSPVLNHNANTANKRINVFTIGESRKAFNFNIEDGPEFRKALNKYETALPTFKKIISCVLDDLTGLELYLNKLLSVKNRLIDHIGQLPNLQFNPLLGKLSFKKHFTKTLHSIFEPFQLNLRFFIKDVCDDKLLLKISQFITSAQHSNISKDSNGEPNELLHNKKLFENNSKEYYNWLNKYLSNEKERPALKLLGKRKVFELSKFDYLNYLNLITNNQYFNQLLENFFKFINLPYDEQSNLKLLSFRNYKDIKLSQDLLGEDYEIYLNILSRFNSEKFQFRQMIEACQTNEELTNLIKYNRLNHSSSVSDKDMTMDTKNILQQSQQQSISNDTTVTKDNLDLIFSNENNNHSSVTAVPINIRNGSKNHSKNSSNDNDDQNSEMSGILYTLGGQGKLGWHKEWVVLKKGRLSEYSDWRNGLSRINNPIHIALSNIKPIKFDKRQYCFEIFTSSGNKHVFQAINEDERNKWIKALHNAGQLTDKLIPPTQSQSIQQPVPQPIQSSIPLTSRNQGSTSSGMLLSTSNGSYTNDNNKEGLTKLNTDFDNTQTRETLPPIIPGQSLDRSISPISIVSNSTPLGYKEDNYLKLVRSVPNSDNNKCVDCGTLEGVEWVSINFLVCFCIKCSSCHRNLGSHISKIKSLKLDNFDKEKRVLLKYINNNEVNEVLEYSLKKKQLDTSKSFKIGPNTSNEERLTFIKNKYVLKKYRLQLANASDLLVKSIQKINIKNILKCILCEADLNINIQISLHNQTFNDQTNDNKIFKKISLFEYSLRKFLEINENGSVEKFFIVSELFLLNGCKIDHLINLNHEIGLSDEAINYWKVSSFRLSGKSPV